MRAYTPGSRARPGIASATAARTAPVTALRASLRSSWMTAAAPSRMIVRSRQGVSFDTVTMLLSSRTLGKAVNGCASATVWSRMVLRSRSDLYTSGELGETRHAGRTIAKCHFHQCAINAPPPIEGGCGWGSFLLPRFALQRCSSSRQWRRLQARVKIPPCRL